METKYLDPGGRGGGGGGGAAHDVSLVLKPVPSPSPRRPSPAESTKTLVNEYDINDSHDEKLDKRSSPRPYPLNRIRSTHLAMSSLRYVHET